MYDRTNKKEMVKMNWLKTYKLGKYNIYKTSHPEWSGFELTRNSITFFTTTITIKGV